jgi:hypothetical protein
VYRFPDATRADASSVEVAGVFAFPKRDMVPLAFGTAASSTLAEAVARAWQECVQRLAFLWGEAIPTDVPQFEPTPSYHQDLYLCPRMHGRLRAWLEGGHQKDVSCEASAPPGDNPFADLTPEHLRGKISVVKALPLSELQLAFGRHCPGIEPRLQRGSVHPIP